MPFSAKFQKVHPSTKGVTVLEHLERLDAAEAGLQRLGVEEPLMEEDEVDVGECSFTRPEVITTMADEVDEVEGTQDMSASQQLSPPGSPLTSIPEDVSLGNSVTEEDLAMMSKSMSHVDPPAHHGRWNGQGEPGQQQQQQLDRNLDWMDLEDGDQRKRTVIVEVGVSVLSDMS